MHHTLKYTLCRTHLGTPLVTLDSPLGNRKSGPTRSGRSRTRYWMSLHRQNSRNLVANITGPARVSFNFEDRGNRKCPLRPFRI